ncbi:MAG TPA: Ig-like domain-containing protein, partial [Patescibacteria group bacterium]|nr:Ig-like domain-containing protein [Patescibacteria group bacterium]
ITFTTAADTAPSVQTITPAHQASGIAVNASIAVSFTENVQVTDPWITLSCLPSGAHPGTLSGGGSSYQLDPGSDFTPGDACTVTLTAANIVDQDGAPQTLDGQSTFTFDVAPDLAPNLLSTFPADNAVNVAVVSNLTVTFDEPVSIASPAQAFAIACGATAHPFALSDTNQTTYTLDPNDDFALDTECTLTIVANEIIDIDGTPNELTAGATITFTTSAGVSGYYERVDPTSCRALRATLHGVIDDHHSVSYGPVAGPNNDTWELLEPADVDPLDPTKILDVYENKKFARVTDRASSVCTGRYNREHTWPKSLGFPSETGDMGLPNAPHTDGHMLYLSNCDYNSHRGNSPYRTCATPGSCSADPTQLNHGEGGAGVNNLYTGSFYDTWPKRRGDVARAVLYMDFRYEGGTHSTTNQSEPDLVLTYGADGGTPGSLDTLLAWHNADPPSNPQSNAPLDNIEVLRNDSIELIQHNRNPLIDHPEWAATIFASPCNGPAVVAVDDDFTTAKDTPLNAPSPGVLRDDHNGVSKNGQGLTASLAIQAQQGTAVITNGATGAFTYTPNPGFCGTDQFTYQVTNGSVIDQGIAYIVVTGTNCSVGPTDAIFDDSFETATP